MNMMRLMGDLRMKAARGVYDEYVYDMAWLFSNDYQPMRTVLVLIILDGRLWLYWY